MLFRSIGRFEAKEDGTYRIRVIDLFNRADANAGLSYRLALRKEAPAFRLVALPEASQVKKAATDVMLWSASLRRGETIPIRLVAIRTDGFKDDINVSVEGLPKGVTFTETRIPASSNSVTTTVSSSTSSGTDRRQEEIDPTHAAACTVSPTVICNATPSATTVLRDND